MLVAPESHPSSPPAIGWPIWNRFVVSVWFMRRRVTERERELLEDETTLQYCVRIQEAEESQCSLVERCKVIAHLRSQRLPIKAFQNIQNVKRNHGACE